ncbi:chondroadherin-like protein [Labrus mixtus]|uniref:chondroadherin-like protein n=1 Tax=Labrus mixtus TaxID=508554 RepID=UPI0029BFE91A|nr:chondroadherin-like protein [Labrus mixtus]
MSSCPVVLVVLVVMVTSLSLSVETFRCPGVCSCDRSKLSVSCVRKNLTQVPPTLDQISLNLDLKNNQLQVLTRGAFTHTPYLTHLNLQRCDITQVKEGAFRSLGRLVSLNLAYNNINILYQESFDGLSSLKDLYLDHNRIEEIRPGAFTQLGLLNMLELTHNQLVYLPNMVFQGLNSIKWLRLSSNSVNNLSPESFTGLFALSRLSLDHNELQFFPTQTMNRLRELARLDLSYNPMTYLGEESVSMAKLTHLYLDHMSLQDLSEHALSGTPHLSHLDLSFNQLRHLEPLKGPTELRSLNLTGNPAHCDCHLRPLREWGRRSGVKLLGACAGPPHLSDEPLQAVHPSNLRCHSGGEALQGELEGERESTGNASPTEKPKKSARCPVTCDCDTDAQHATCEARALSTVPRGFPSNTRLLDLRANSFHFLPTASFPRSSQVVSLHLELCRIQEIEGGAFRGMKQLTYLYLSHNLITCLHPHTFTGTPELTYLHLDGNALTQFPGTALKLLPALFVLHLERNIISHLEPAALLSSVTPALRELYLTNNTISSISQGALDSAHLAVLHLDSNQLTEVPTQALCEAAQLEELNLSYNTVAQVGPDAFLPISQSLRRLHLDHMGLEKVSVVALGPALRTLTLRGNLLQEVPDLSPLSHLEEVDLQENPLTCDCSLLHLRRWLEKVSSEGAATCAHPPEVRGQTVREVDVFQSCPEIVSPPDQSEISSSGLFKMKKPKLSVSKEPAVKTKGKTNPTKPTKKKKKPAAAKNKKPQ